MHSSTTGGPSSTCWLGITAATFRWPPGTSPQGASSGGDGWGDATSDWTRAAAVATARPATGPATVRPLLEGDSADVKSASSELAAWVWRSSSEKWDTAGVTRAPPPAPRAPGGTAALDAGGGASSCAAATAWERSAAAHALKA